MYSLANPDYSKQQEYNLLKGKVHSTGWEPAQERSSRLLKSWGSGRLSNWGRQKSRCRGALDAGTCREGKPLSLQGLWRKCQGVQWGRVKNQCRGAGHRPRACPSGLQVLRGLEGPE